MGKCSICYERFQGNGDLCALHAAIAEAERYASCQLCPKIETPEALANPVPFFGWLAHLASPSEPGRFQAPYGRCNLCGKRLPPPNATAHVCPGPPTRGDYV